VASELVPAFMPTPPSRATSSSNSLGFTYCCASACAASNAFCSSSTFFGSAPRASLAFCQAM
jgi:hypothetical protein